MDSLVESELEEDTEVQTEETPQISQTPQTPQISDNNMNEIHMHILII